MTKETIIKIIPVLGSIILFLSWVFQQSWLEDANGALQQISAAQSIFQTYQSNNALFNAVLEAIKDNPDSVEQVRRTQVYNYELGLRELEALLDAEARTDIPKPPNPFSGTSDVATLMGLTQERINKIQGELALKRDEITRRKSSLNTMFLILYAVGSITVLIGSALNEVKSTKASEVQTRSKQR